MQNFQETLHATYLLKLLDKMYRYGSKQNCRRYRADTGCGTNGRADGRTDGRTEWNQYTPTPRILNSPFKAHLKGTITVSHMTLLWHAVTEPFVCHKWPCLNIRQVITVPFGMTIDVIKWKHFPCYWPFVWEIRRSPVNSPRKGQWRGALMFSLICAWVNGWVNNREAGDLRRHQAHYGVIVMVP